MRAGDRLADLVRAAGYRISTGFVGTPLICDALTSTGHPDVAHRLLLQTGVPVLAVRRHHGRDHGLGAVGQHAPRRAGQPGEMTSFNHYALGAVADWMHRSVAGLAPAAPGYRHLLVRPIPPAQLTSASARHVTPYGPAEVQWSRSDGELDLQVSVPVGSGATVYVPGSAGAEIVGPGHHRWRVADPLPATAGVPVTIRDAMDDDGLWPKIVTACCASGVLAGEVDAAYRLSRYLDLPVPELARALVPPETLQLPGDLAEQLATALPAAPPATATGPMTDPADAVPVNTSRGGTDG